MSDIENIEIRVCLMGDHGVGKKSIISRFKILNSTQTIDEGKLHKPDDHKPKEGLKEIPKKLTDTFYSKNMDQQYKKKLKKLINFTKILSVSSYNLSFRFFPISPAEPLPDNMEIKEEDEDYQFEKNYRLRLKNVKEEIQNVIMKTTKNPLSTVELLFLFCFNLTDFSSFEKIRIYYVEMNKFFNFHKGYHKALIGNKFDAKIPFDETQKTELENFISENNFSYYEISTKMFFNFEKFFEQMFFEVFGTLRKDFEASYFKEKFSNVMMLRPSFPRSERAPPKPNDNPSPQNYSANVYDIGNDVKAAFSAKRFMTKIFVNKQGPLFTGIDRKKQEKLKIEKREKKEKKEKEEKKKKEYSSDIDKKKDKSLSAQEKTKSEKRVCAHESDSQRKKNLQESLEIRIPGYSIGLKKSHLDLKKQRKVEYKRRMREFERAFDVDNITTNIARSTSVRGDEYFKKANQKREEMLMKKIQESKDSYARYNKLRPKKSEPGNVSETDSVNSSRKKDSRNSSAEIKRKMMKDYGNEIKRPNDRRNLIRRPKSHKIIKKKFVILPGPNSYDIRAKFDPTKGFSFAGKYPDNSMKNKISAPYVLLKSDIDIMLERPRLSFQASVPRKRQHKEFSISKIIDTWNKWEYQKINSDRFRNIQDFIEKRKDLSKNNCNKKEIEKRQLLEAVEEEERRKREDYYELSQKERNMYKLVEECAPQYSIKGRYDKGFINVQENYDDPGNLYTLEKSVTQLAKKEEINRRTSLPNYNVVKPSLPSFSFPVAERFQKENLNYLPTTQISKNNPTIDTLTNSIDKHFPHKHMGRAKKNNSLKMSSMPGPGQYKIKGFAEIRVEEAEKINALKARSKSPQEKKLSQDTVKKNEAVINHEDNVNSIFQSGDDDDSNHNTEEKGKSLV